MERIIKFQFFCLFGMIILTTMLAIRIDILSCELIQTKEWISSLQQILTVAQVSSPCKQCGNNIFNTLMMPCNAVYEKKLPASYCAKCNTPQMRENGVKKP